MGIKTKERHRQSEEEKMRHRLQPATVLLYLTVVVFLSLFFTHPFYLLALFLAVAIVIFSFDLIREWSSYLKIGLCFLVVIMFVNVFLVREGATVLFLSPAIPGLGRIRITFEALCYGAGMGLRLLVIISAFCLFMYVVHPDGIIRLLGGRSYKIALALGLSLRLFPLMRADFLRIMQVQQCRGVNFHGQGWRERTVKTIPVIKVLLLSSLERAFQLAESLQARGYGLGKRTSFMRNRWRIGDKLIVVAICLVLCLSMWLVMRGQTEFHYYPRLQSVGSGDFFGAVFLGIFLMIPAFLNWGWKKWPTLRSRI
ncbi:MAG: energy-coupling factor transporter transmembrane protein EcfT [Clostridia bacterium]|nr:energy-coupling factor transporter transmembrane protein EcfT [Clostridia bacterium]